MGWRVFDNHVAWPVAFLAAFELLLYPAGLVVAFTLYPLFAKQSLSFESVDTLWAASATLVSGACIFASGLYNRQMFSIGAKLARHLATTITLFVLFSSAVVALYSWLYTKSFSTVFALVVFSICFQICGMILVRALSLNFFELMGYRWRLLVLGPGPHADRIEGWLRELDTRLLEMVRHNPVSEAVPVHRLSYSGTNVAELIASHHAAENDLISVVNEKRVDEIVVETREGSGVLEPSELLRCRAAGVRVTDFLSFWERETGRIDLEAIDATWLVFAGGFRNSRLRRFNKRSMDIIFSLAGLLLTAPLLPFIALAIRLESPGPVVYRQKRTGKDGRVFTMLKFRSMRADAERDQTPRWAKVGDARVTRLGSFLRRTRIDEIPQLLNVLKGEMSLVGPRPERPNFVATFNEQIPFYDLRHAVRPGITGWAQINYPYGASLDDAKKKLEYDLFYTKNNSAFLDVAILLQTLRIILWREGAR